MKPTWGLVAIALVFIGCENTARREADAQRSYADLLQVYTNEQAELKRIDDQMHAELGAVLQMSKLAGDVAPDPAKALEFNKRAQALDKKIRAEYKPKLDAQAERVAETKAAMEAVRP